MNVPQNPRIPPSSALRGTDLPRWWPGGSWRAGKVALPWVEVLNPAGQADSQNEMWLASYMVSPKPRKGRENPAVSLKKNPSTHSGTLLRRLFFCCAF